MHPCLCCVLLLRKMKVFSLKSVIWTCVNHHLLLICNYLVLESENALHCGTLLKHHQRDWVSWTDSIDGLKILFIIINITIYYITCCYSLSHKCFSLCLFKIFLLWSVKCFKCEAAVCFSFFSFFFYSGKWASRQSLCKSP